MSINKDPVVRLSGNRLITTSLAVSQHFAKKHQHVMEAIRNLDCTHEFNESNFRPIDYLDRRQRTKPAYEITRDGFMFLCMGFTGHAAAKWKERYIAAFNQLDQQANHHLPALKKAVLQAHPLWSKISHYKEIGLNHAEIGRLLDRSTTGIRDHVRRMEKCGLLQAPSNLPQLQQMALHLIGGK